MSVQVVLVMLGLPGLITLLIIGNIEPKSVYSIKSLHAGVFCW